MYIRIISIILFSIFVLALPVTGEDLTQTDNFLTLDQVMVIALQNNPGLAQQVNGVKSAEITFSQQQTDLYPDLKLETKSSEDLDTNVELSTSVNLFNGFADMAAIRNSELLLEAELADLSQQQQLLIFETVSQFIQVLTNQELIHVEESNLEENQKLLERIQRFYESGKLPVSDLYQQQSDTKQAELELLEANHTLNISKLLLMQTMGLPPTTRYQVASPDFANLPLQLPSEDPTQLTFIALEKRADLKAREHQVKAAEQQIREAKAGHLPKVDLVAALATDYSGYWDDFMDENFDSTIGVTLSIPLFDRFTARNNTTKAQIEKRNEQLVLKEKQLQAGLEVVEAIQGYQKTKKQVDVVDSKLTHARQALDSYEERYKVGASTLVELSEARTQYVTAAFDRIETKYDLISQQISVVYYLGNLKETVTALLVKED